MESKNIFLFVFVFLINKKILVYSEDYGYIVIGFDVKVSRKEDFREDNIEFNCDDRECEIHFLNDFKNLSYFFSRATDKVNNIKYIYLSNLKIIPNNLKGMFAYCEGLQKIYGFSKFDTSEVTDMSEMFYKCNSLLELDLSFDTSLVKNMSFMFYDVVLENINVTNLKTSSVQDMSSMFQKDSENVSNEIEQNIIGLTNFDTSKVTTMKRMFFKSVGLLSLDLSSFNTSILKNMVEMFCYCKRLKSLDISNFNLNSKIFLFTFSDVNLKYINIYNVIYKSSDSDFLSVVSFLDSSITEGLTVCQKEQIIKGKKVTNRCCLFDVKNLKCPNYIIARYNIRTEYKYGFIRNYNGDKNPYRTDIDYIINGENNVTAEQSLIILASSEIKIYFKNIKKNIEHFFDSTYDSHVVSINFIDLSYLIIDNLTQTNSLFKGCSSLASFNLSSKIKLSLTRMDSMFSGCTYLQLLDLSQFEASSITNMSHMFEAYIRLKNINLKNLDTSNVVDMNSMFSECFELEEINITNFKTSNLTDMSKMFYKCQKLKIINLSSFDTKSVKYMDKLFYNCLALEILDIKNFDLTNVVSFDSIFTNTDKIKYIDLMNLISEKNIWESLNKSEKFYICQSREIINHPLALNCCKFLINPNECGHTQLMFVPKTDTSPNSTSDINLILALFSKYNQSGNICSFNSCFTSSKPDYTYSKTINITSKVIYNRALRGLEEEEKTGICTLRKDGINSNANYLCEIQVDNSNIKNVEITNFHFNSEDNITLSMTPIAKRLINNIQDSNKFNSLSDAEIYILDHCIMNRYQKKLMNISGEIQDPQPTLKTKDLVLMINLDSENDSQNEINCTFTDIKAKNYSLNCKITQNMKGDFQNAISFIDDNILILNFDSLNESKIDNIGNQRGVRYNFNKKNKGISGGAIVAIVLASIVCIGSLIAALMIFGKKQNSLEDSTIVSLNKIK